jgi:hypothetical protein
MEQFESTLPLSGGVERGIIAQPIPHRPEVDTVGPAQVLANPPRETFPNAFAHELIEQGGMPETEIFGYLKVTFDFLKQEMGGHSEKLQLEKMLPGLTAAIAPSHCR